MFIINFKKSLLKSFVKIEKKIFLEKFGLSGKVIGIQDPRRFFIV